MQQVVIPTSTPGAILSKLRMAFGQDAKIQESYIRVEKVLTAQDVAEKFNLVGGSGVRRPLEQYVGKNDIEVVYAMGVFLNKIADTGKNGNNGNCVDYSYPDLGVFSAAAVAGVTEAAALEAIYSGHISLKSDTYEALNKLSLKRFRVAPETQLAATTQASLGGHTANGFVPLIMPSMLSGQAALELEFSPAQGADVEVIGGASGTQNILAFEFKSFVIRNAAQSLTADTLEKAIRLLNGGA